MVYFITVRTGYLTIVIFIIYDVDYEKSYSMMSYHKNQVEKSKGPYITQRNEVKNTASKMTSTS